MTTSSLQQTRGWVVTAAGLAQVAAARAGMLPWWALPVTVTFTLVVARQTGPVDEALARIVRGVAVSVIGVFAIFVTARDLLDVSVRANPVSTMRSFTEALVVLSLAMAPSWRSARDYRVWLCVTTGILIAAAVGSQSLTTDILLVAAWVLVLLAMAAIQRAALAASVTTPRASTPPVDPGRIGTAMPVLASLAAGILVFLALPAGVGGGGLASHLVHDAVGTTPSAAPTTRGAVGVDTVGAGTLDLLVRGSLPTTPLLRVPADSPPLWRGSIYTTYTGDEWLADPDERLSFVPATDTTVPTTPVDPVPAGTTRVDRATFANGFHSSLLWAPGVPLEVRGVGGQLRGIIRGTTNVRVVGAQEVSGYRVTSAVAPTSPARLDAATGSGRVSPMWTALPAELPVRVSQLAHELAAHAPTRYAQVTAIEAYLRTHETYSLNSPVPGPGQDAVYDFLFRDHVGFCEQFASAAAVLLRTIGVPARVVTGLAYGTPEGNTRLLTAADAHAWVEVFYPGIGWSPTDPTAGVPLAPSSTGSRSTLTAVLHRISAALPGGRLALLGLAIAALLLAIAIGQAARRRLTRPRSPRSAGTDGRPVLAAFLRFTNRRRAPARERAETAREYVGRVAPDGQLDPAMATLEQECYGTWPPGDDEVGLAVAAFQGERLP